MLSYFLFFKGSLPAAEKDAFHYNALLGRGVNLGNALDAPSEGEWGITIQENWFKLIKQAGFDSVRIPIRWSAHADKQPPYTIDTTFAQRVDRVIDQALAQDLAVVINIHHYEEIHQDPAAHKDRFLSLWSQIAERYSKQPDRVFFELLNEPNEDLTSDVWNQYLVEAIDVVRQSSPERMLIVGPGKWNNVNELKHLKLPQDDRRLIATFHYYLPFEFTHQGAEWSEGTQQWLGRAWPRTPREKQDLIDDFDSAAKWAKAENRPLYVGEFGAYSKADRRSRTRWTAFVREQAESRGMSWAYWEFAAGFGVYDPDAEQWRQPLLEALIPNEESLSKR